MKKEFLLFFIILFSIKCSPKDKKPTISANEIQDYKSSITIYLQKKYIQDTISATEFGVKADYNGKSGTDNRKYLQIAIDYCSTNKKVLLLPKGKILVNSYTINKEFFNHGSILELKSNTNIIGDNSEIIVGNYFDDKPFIVFSGFNAENTDDFKTIKDIIIKSITIDFNVLQSRMKSKYLLRKGIELGHCVNAEIQKCIFKNGDITCAVASGFGNKNISTNVQIFNNQFLNLINSDQNIDHTSVYINSSKSKVYNNKFISNTIQGKLVACATEFHNSDCDFFNNTIEGYTRMMFLASTLSENHLIKNLKIFNNNAKITNAAIYLWLEKGTNFNNILIENNNFYSTHVPNKSMLYNGTQGIIADAKDEKNTDVSNMVIRNNKINITNTVFKGRAVKYATKYKFVDINNPCTGCNDGVFYKR